MPIDAVIYYQFKLNIVTKFYDLAYYRRVIIKRKQDAPPAPRNVVWFSAVKLCGKLGSESVYRNNLYVRRAVQRYRVSCKEMIESQEDIAADQRFANHRYLQNLFDWFESN